MLPKVDHLYPLRHDTAAFEFERSRIISEYIKSLPEDKRNVAYLMQLKIDEARMRLSSEELLKWMVAEAAELAENLDDLFLVIKHRVDEITRISQ